MTEPITWATLDWSGIRAMEQAERLTYRCGQCWKAVPFLLWLACDAPMVCNKCYERVWNEIIDLSIKMNDRRTEP